MNDQRLPDEPYQFRVSTGDSIPLVNAQKPLHWAAAREAMAPWKAAIGWELLRHRYHLLRFDRIQLTCQPVYPKSRPGPLPDADALAAVAKVVLDLTVVYGIIPDDTTKHAAHTRCLGGYKTPLVDAPTLVCGIEPVSVDVV